MRRKLSAALLTSTIAALAVGLAAPVSPVQATRVMVSVRGGPLGLAVSEPAVLGPLTLTGADQETNGTLGLIDIRDGRGTGAGWNVVADATDFISRENAARTISASGFSIADAAVTWVAGNDPPRAFGGRLDSPVKLLSAAPTTGMGHFQTEPPVTLNVPADAFAGTYDSTLTLTISSGP